MKDFSYYKPSTVSEAVAMLAASGENRPLSGGMTLLPTMKMRLASPTAIVDLAALPGLTAITVGGGSVTIGAMTTHAEVAASPEVKQAFPALAELAGNIGDRQVRSRGTIGGSLANNDPSACYPAAVLALDAVVRTDRRDIPAAEFFQGLFTTALEPGELITAVIFSSPQCAAYVKFANPASRYAMVGVFVAKTAAGARVAVTGAGQNGVFRHTAMEQALDKSFTPEALESVATDEDMMNADIHGSAAYRAHLVGVIARRAVKATLA